MAQPAPRDPYQQPAADVREIFLVAVVAQVSEYLRHAQRRSRFLPKEKGGLTLHMNVFREPGAAQDLCTRDGDQQAKVYKLSRACFAAR